MGNELLQISIQSIYFNQIFQPFISTIYFHHLFQPLISTSYFNQLVQPFISTIYFNHFFEPVISSIYFQHSFQLFKTFGELSQLSLWRDLGFQLVGTTWDLYFTSFPIKVCSNTGGIPVKRWTRGQGHGDSGSLHTVQRGQISVPGGGSGSSPIKRLSQNPAPAQASQSIKMFSKSPPPAQGN